MTSVQHKPRKSRLSADDLTSLARQRLADVVCQYYHNTPYGFDTNGWYILKYVGKNWVEAQEYINRNLTIEGRENGTV